jgi:hypothetical protein
MFIQDPGSDFFPSRIRFFSFPDPGFDPGSGSALKNLSILTQETDIKLSPKRSGMFIQDHGSWLWIFSHPGSRIQGSKKHRIPDPRSGSRIPDPDSQHFCQVIFKKVLKIEAPLVHTPNGIDCSSRAVPTLYLFFVLRLNI